MKLPHKKMNLSHKKTNKNRKPQPIYYGGEQGKNEAVQTVIDASMKLLFFIKTKLARFAGFVPIEEQKTNDVTKNLGEVGDKGAASGIDTLNTALSSPQVKTAVAQASEKLVTTLKDITKTAQEKLNDPEFQQVVINTVKQLSDLSLKLAAAAEPALNKTIDESSEIISQMMNKFAVSMANASLSFVEAIPGAGEVVAVLSLLHNIASAVFAVMSTMLKFVGTGANFTSIVKDNWDKNNASSPTTTTTTSPTLFTKLTDYANTKYQALKPHLENLSSNLNSNIQDVLKVDLKNPSNLNAVKSQIQGLLNNKELFNASNLSASAKATIDKLEDKLGPLTMSLSPETQSKLKELKEKVSSGIDSVSTKKGTSVEPCRGGGNRSMTGGALQKRIFKSINEFKKTNHPATRKRRNKNCKTKKRRR